MTTCPRFLLSNPSAPRAIASHAFPGTARRRKEVRLTVSDHPRRLASFWQEGSKDDYVLVRLSDGAISHPPMTTNPFAPNKIEYVPQPGTVLVECSTFCGKFGGVRVMAHPDDVDTRLVGHN